MSSNDVTKRWYLRTHTDGDTHRGILADTGIVTTDCGIHFPPQRLAIRAFAFRGYPPDPDQVCPQCKAVPAPTPRART
jgi:hypothetical protein